MAALHSEDMMELSETIEQKQDRTGQLTPIMCRRNRRPFVLGGGKRLQTAWPLMHSLFMFPGSILFVGNCFPPIQKHRQTEPHTMNKPPLALWPIKRDYGQNWPQDSQAD